MKEINTQMKNIITVSIIIILLVLIVYFGFTKTEKSNPAPEKTTDQKILEYNPAIDPKNFVSVIDNPYYTLTPGKNFTYQSKTVGGTEKNIMIVTDKTKTILGVKTLEVWDRVWLDENLIEETFDWYAQDTDGNVWYFGENSREYEGGRVISSKGSWVGGVNDAKPGIIMKANPMVGDSYRQEYLKGEAEDMADVVALGETVTMPRGTYTNCIKTRDWSKIDPHLNEYKYYSMETGNLVLEVAADTGERTELMSASD